MSEMDSLFNALDKISQGGNAAVSWLTSKGNVETDGYQSCHAVVNRAPAGCTMFASRTQRKSRGYNCSLGVGGWVGDEYAVPYYDWLINHSPYSDPILTKDPEYVVNKGIVVDSDHPCNLILGGFIAQRYCWENPQLVKNILFFNKIGLSMNMAFSLCHILDMNEDRKPQQVFLQNHTAINGYNLSETQIKNFLVGNKVRPLHHLKKHTYYNNVSRLWGDEVGFSKELLELTSSMKTEVESVNPFGEVFKKEEKTKITTPTSVIRDKLAEACFDRYGKEAVHA